MKSRDMDRPLGAEESDDLRTVASSLAISKPLSVREEAVEKLRKAIVEGLLPPGSRISEPEIAHAMGISRGPLREAIFQLEREGLLRHEAQRGARVMRVSLADVAEIYELRGMIERGAAETVAGKLTSNDLRELRGLANKLGDRSLSPEELFRMDLEFHEEVCARAGNDRLLEVWRQLRNQALVCYSLTTMSALLRDRAYSRKLVGDHVALVKALASSPLKAGESFVEHIQGASRRLLEVIGSEEVGDEGVLTSHPRSGPESRLASLGKREE